ncbi:hypothetical protein BC833DRAFT_603500 [Globomyces pollinis-pini]|nr:hypothetical protein BC833DRAFT_603500 [Globomyces pollinis-pini]
MQFLLELSNTSNPEELNHFILARIDYLRDNNNHAYTMQKMPFWKLAINRCPAILATLLLELIVGFVIAEKQHLIQSHILMTSFLPILSAIAGNVGLQSSTATLRALATGHAKVDSRGFFRVLRKEFATSLVIAFIAGSMIFLVAWGWSWNLAFAFTTGFSILLNSTMAGMLGSLGPLTFRSLNVDPAVMAGPFETAFQDLIGTSIYLIMASIFLTAQ